MNRSHRFFLTAATTLVAATSAHAQFTAGNLVVDRNGNGTQMLANTGNSIFLDQYSTTGSLINSVAIPSTGTTALLNSGTATSEGAISLTGDRSALTIAGYNTPQPYTASVSGATSANVPRAVATVNALGQYTFVTQTTSFSGNNVRTAVGTSPAGNFYAGGGSSGTVLVNGGATGTAIQTTSANTRVNNIFNGVLYYSAAAGGSLGIYSLGGTPTAATTPTLLLSTGTGSSPYDFALNSTGSILYVADDRAIANGGGIQRYDFSAGAFTLSYTLGTGNGSTVGARGLAVDFSGATPLVYATTAEGSADRLISIVDIGSASAATTLATAGTNQIFRGLDFAPAAVPEPSTYALIGAGGLGLLLWGRGGARRRSARA